MTAPLYMVKEKVFAGSLPGLREWVLKWDTEMDTGQTNDRSMYRQTETERKFGLYHMHTHIGDLGES